MQGATSPFASTPSRSPSSPRHIRNSHVRSSHAPCTGRGGRRRRAGRGGGLARVQRGRGASPSAAGVACCFPDPSSPTTVAPPHPFSLPRSVEVACCPLTLTLHRRRLPTSRVARGLVHPRPPSPGSRAASPTLPRVARLAASPPCWKRGGSSAERTGA